MVVSDLMLAGASHAVGAPRDPRLGGAARRWGLGGGVDWVRAELDARGPKLSANRRAQVSEVFDGTLAAEIPFHAAAYG